MRFLVLASSALLLAACAPSHPVTEDPANDPSCVAYFDGCNTCSKMPDGGAACTKKGCAPEMMEEAYCMEYASESDI